MGAVIQKDLPANYTKKQVAKELQRSTYLELAKEQKKGNFNDPVYQVNRGFRSDDKKIIKKATNMVEITERAASLVKALKYLIPRLLDKSPVLSGEYRRSHYMDIDGKRTLQLSAINIASLKDIVADAKEVRIYNNTIYANKLEREANSSSRQRGNLIYITAHGVYDFFSKKIRGASFSGVIARVGRSDRYPVRKNPRYNTNDGKEIVLPVIYLSIDNSKGVKR